MFDIKLLIGLDAGSIGHVADAASVGSDQQKPSTLSAQRQTRIFIGRNPSLSTLARRGTGKFGDQVTRLPLTSFFCFPSWLVRVEANLEPRNRCIGTANQT